MQILVCFVRKGMFSGVLNYLMKLKSLIDCNIGNDMIKNAGGATNIENIGASGCSRNKGMVESAFDREDFFSSI